MEEVKDRIKKHEGFIAKPYLDSLGKATIGYGHLITDEANFEEGKECSKDELLKLFDKDFEKAKNGASKLYEGCEISDIAKGLIIEMVFQLGPTGVKKFRNFWKDLKQTPPQYDVAATEMMDSRWAKQTPSRAKELSGIMREI